VSISEEKRQKQLIIFQKVIFCPLTWSG